MSFVTLTHVLPFGVTASYLTLGISDSHAAGEVWWAYGVVMLVLTGLDFLLDLRHAREP